ncbi:MAG: hypothetical protein HYX27_13425 [Acidobacteria bacterium]|nr:hypothetical protein [Acidobacteriota bacterium]
MPTLYVEGVPEETYEALRAHARANRTSISSEVLKLLEGAFPTRAELARRRKAYETITKRYKKPNRDMPSTLDLIREDRAR